MFAVFDFADASGRSFQLWFAGFEEKVFLKVSNVVGFFFFFLSEKTAFDFYFLPGRFSVSVAHKKHVH